MLQNTNQCFNSINMRYLILFTLLVTTICSAQRKNNHMIVTFSDGPFKGTHTFYPEKGNYASQLNLEFHDGVSNINASKLVTKDGIQIHYINRHFIGEATKGTHKPKKYTSGCGSLNFIDQQNKQSYKRINGDFVGCSTTTISNISKWKDGIIKKRRSVSGNFKDNLEMEIRMDDGTTKTIIAVVEVQFTVTESRRK